MMSVSSIGKEYRFNLMKQIYQKGYGAMKDLRAMDKETNGQLVDEFLSVGFIKTGFTRKYKTWGITKLLKSYVEELGLVPLSKK